MNGIGIGEEEKKRRDIKIYLREDDDEKGWRRYLGGDCPHAQYKRLVGK